ncbi:MAG: DUF3089 domain-containing protein [Proteobacteria bacterium]|nr:DUF3089 domain-containing protein [Pseudomonadota bacterium]
MARKFLYLFAILTALVIVGSILIAIFIKEISFWAVTPPDPFEQYAAPPVPDYSIAGSWAALPEKQDKSDLAPLGYLDTQDSAVVDVFFVHPTTYLSRQSWNAAIDARDASQLVDDIILRYQASAYSGCCRIFAPYYRQATLGSFFEPNQTDGQKALLFAYEDVRRAFRDFIDNRNSNRPFIVAGHSQGSWHLVNLLRDEILGTPLADRMVAAYPIGYAIPDDILPGIEPCSSAEQTGCLVTWSTFLEGSDSSGLGDSTGFDYGDGIEPSQGKQFVCVNPLSWTTSDTRSPASLNIGAIPAIFGSKDLPTPDPGVASAQCRNGTLYTALEKTDGYDALPFLEGNQHAYDYNLFYMNLRENALHRVDAYLAKQPDNETP